MSGCGHKNLPAHRYCVVCGDILERMICPQCKYIGLVSFGYCSECGGSMENAIISKKSPFIVNALPADSSVPSVIFDNTVDLNSVLLLIEQQEDQVLSEKLTEKLSQADIKKLLKRNKKNVSK